MSNMDYKVRPDDKPERVVEIMAKAVKAAGSPIYAYFPDTSRIEMLPTSKPAEVLKKHKERPELGFDTRKPIGVPFGTIVFNIFSVERFWDVFSKIEAVARTTGVPVHYEFSGETYRYPDRPEFAKIGQRIGIN